jgi:nickel superoxide dismutase
MFKFPEAQAHCDIPCKIYDPCVAQFAALSIVRLMDLIAEFGDLNTPQLARLISQKESHAAQVKHDVTTIWGDYFKQPQIHKVTHGIMQAASKCKQGSVRDDGVELLSQLNQFAELFWHSSDIPTESVIAPYPPALEVVHPVLAHA